MDKERVKYYSRSDYFYSYMLNKALEKLKIFDSNKEVYSLEEILEIYNIVKYIDDDAKSLVVNEEDKKLFSILLTLYLILVIKINDDLCQNNELLIKGENK